MSSQVDRDPPGLVRAYSKALTSRREFMRVSAIAATLATISPLLAACGGDDDDNEATTPTASTSAPTTAATTPTVSGAGNTPAATGPTATTAAATQVSATTAPEPTATTAPQGDVQRGGTLTFGVEYDTTLFDLLRSFNSPRGSVAILEALITRDDAGAYQPWLADGWEVAPGLMRE